MIICRGNSSLWAKCLIQKEHKCLLMKIAGRVCAHLRAFRHTWRPVLGNIEAISPSSIVND